MLASLAAADHVVRVFLGVLVASALLALAEEVYRKCSAYRCRANAVHQLYLAVRYTGWPPSHPNCRCVLWETTPDERTRIDHLYPAWYDEAGSLDDVDFVSLERRVMARLAEAKKVAEDFPDDL